MAPARPATSGRGEPRPHRGRPPYCGAADPGGSPTDRRLSRSRGGPPGGEATAEPGGPRSKRSGCSGLLAAAPSRPAPRPPSSSTPCAAPHPRPPAQLGARPEEGAAATALPRPGPPAAPPPRPSSPAPRPPLAALEDEITTDDHLIRWSRRSRRTCSRCRGRPRDRRRSSWSPPATTPSGCAANILRAPVRRGPVPACSGRTNRHRLNRGGDRQPTTLSAHRAGPDAHHPPTQAYVTTNQRRPVQTRDHALPQALHRPRGLPAPHKPATHGPSRLPEIGGINEPHEHGHDGAERWHSARSRVPLVASLVDLARGLAPRRSDRRTLSGLLWTCGV